MEWIPYFLQSVSERGPGPGDVQDGAGGAHPVAHGGQLEAEEDHQQQRAHHAAAHTLPGKSAGNTNT